MAAIPQNGVRDFSPDEGSEYDVPAEAWRLWS
jgi:hypothetical protein